ncbi:MAG: undecaprenyl-phosphate glucose phosphotransferase [Halothiobacillus sp.]|nr:undecaprenyl-phosphate glucose phosphotransferase [Halothiobacillus sp.]
MVRAGDVLVVAFAGVLAYLWRFGVAGFPMPPRYSLLILTGALLLLAIFDGLGVYRSWRGGNLVNMFGRVLIGWAAVVVALLVLLFMLKVSDTYSRLWLSTWALLAGGFLLAERFALYGLLRWFRLRGRNQKKVVMVGQSEVARELLRSVRSSSWTGFDVVAVFGDLASSSGAFDGIDLHREMAGLEGYLREHDVAEVWITLPLRDEARVRDVLHLLRHSTVNIRYVPDIFAFRLINHGVSEVAGMPMLDLSTTPMTGMNRLVKALEDRLLSLLILTLISPVMIILAIGVKLTSPGPVFYRQERVGWNGKPFMMLKFRSMPVDTEKSGVQWGNAQAKANTWFGAFIRRTSLDELPQFLNVLKGDMSIVGPRPERTIFVEQFKDEIPDYMKKHLVKAGISGWAQVNGWRGDTDLAKRIEYDLYYIEHWSLWFDLKIIFLTIFKGFVNKNAY